MIQLYGVARWGSDIARGLLDVAGVGYDFIDVTGFDAPGPSRDRLAALNPLCQVPTLVLDDGSVLTETAALALLLGDTCPALVPPPGHADRARFLRLLAWLVANLYPTYTYGDYPARWAPADAEGLRASTDAARRAMYLWLEAQASAPWLLGERFSALDVYMAVMTGWEPGPAWFAGHAPRLHAIGAAARLRLAEASPAASRS